MDFQDTCEINFESSNIGNWKFLLFGMGEPPTAYDELVLMGALHKEGSGIINFQNPFKTTVSVMVNLIKEEFAENVIDIIQKKPKVTISGLGTVQIPFTFYP